MLIKAPNVLQSEITPKSIYFNRRRFLGGLALAFPAVQALRAQPGRKLTGISKSPFSTTEKPNSLQDVTHYNSF